MIKINKVSKEFEEEYFNIVSAKVNNIISNVKMTIKSQKDYNQLETLLSYIKSNLREFILGNPDEVIKEFEKFILEQEIKYNNITNILKKVFDYKKIVGINKKLSHKIIREINVKVCPYCNLNYIEEVENMRSDIDHFYAQSSFEYLAINLNNFVPSCSFCNKIKKDKSFTRKDNIYPYEDGLENVRIFSYELDINKIYVVKNINEDIKFKNNCKSLSLIERYQDCSNIINDIHNKYNKFKNLFYNKSKAKLLNQNIKTDFKDLLGYKPYEVLKDNSCSKFQNDIIDEILNEK